MNILSILILYATLFSPYRQTESPHGADFKVSCTKCHSPKGWVLDKKNYSFNHSTTRMLLLGQHKEVNCRQCHPTLVFSQAKTDCISCHNDIHQSTVGSDCSRCHTPASWLVKNINDIHQVSRFPLIGAHRTADCVDCHKSENLERFDVPGINCIDCHRQNFLAATNPNHVEAGFSEDCITCHSIKSFQWAGAGFNHSIFPLVNSHSTPKCADCHKTARYTDASPDCYSCHDQDYVAATNPDHNAAGYSKTCADCHSLNPAWKPANFDHKLFPLTLGHLAAKCSDCHTGGNYASTLADCYSCHQKDFLATTNPNHNTSGFSKTCTDCHTTNPNWKPTNFNHSIFPLTLGHSAAACIDCHKGNYTSTPADCYSCHQQDYLSTREPDHNASAFSKTCTECHSTNPGWKPTTFNHNSFPLTLGHATPKCSDCHTGGTYASTPIDCYSCHKPNYQATTDPNHSTSGFSINCLECHTTNPGWNPPTFNHSLFPLTQGHAVPKCVDCHKGNYTSIPADCYSCHQQDFQGTTDPNHVASGFSITCTDCHNTNPGWKPTTFNHSQFALTLGHSVPTCSDCHKGNYTSIASDCYSCHQQNFQGTTDPNHVASGFSITCTDCHNTNPGWKPATFNHTRFPLALGHAGPTCADCHKGNYTSTSSDCYACHQVDYNGSINPNHRTLGFSTTCSSCHTTNPDWKPASYAQHDSQFPIYSGSHRGQWNSCADCHTNAANYLSFSCITCHEHNKTDMDNKHRGRSGYSYDSAACFQCHPRGSAG